MFDVIFKKMSPVEILNNFIDWVQNDIFTIDFGVQFVIIALAFTLSFLLKNMFYETNKTTYRRR